MRWITAWLVAALLWCTPAAHAQQANGFVFNAATSLGATSVTSNVALPGSGQRVLLQNTGPNTAFMVFGTSGVVATTSGMPIFPNGCIFMTVTSWTNIAAITSAGTAIILISQGEGTPPISCGAVGALPGTAGFPSGATPITASATGTGVAASTATLALAAGKTTYICGFTWTGTNATAANTATAVTVTGPISGTLNYGFPTLVAGAAVPNTPAINVVFSPCIPASAPATAIVVNGPALGAGSTLATISASGYQL